MGSSLAQGRERKVNVRGDLVSRGEGTKKESK